MTHDKEITGACADLNVDEDFLASTFRRSFSFNIANYYASSTVQIRIIINSS